MPGNEPTVREAADSDAAAWNGFVDAQPESSPMARYEWRGVLRDSYRLRTVFLIAERGGLIVGTLSAFETYGRFGERSFYSVRGGLVVDDAAAERALIDYIHLQTRAEEWSRVLVNSGWNRLPQSEPSQVRSTVQLEIASDPDQLWSSLRGKTRNMIRRAEKEGVQVTSGLHLVDILVDHYHDNMLRLGVAIHSRKFFHNVADRVGPQSEVLVAWHQGKAIASMLLHFGRDVACYPYQNALTAYRSMAPIQMPTWVAMKSCVAHHVRILDMGESRSGSPVFNSKVNFGGMPRPVFYYDVASPLAAGATDGPIVRQFRRVASVIDTWLAARSPMPLRRQFAQKEITRGRVL